MEGLTPGIITAILTPVAATIVGLFAARFGVTANLKKTEYRLKRAELIEKLLSIKPKVSQHLTKNQDWNFIENELEEIVNFVSSTSSEKSSYINYQFENRPFLIRIISLPKPRTFIGWVGAVIFYLYGFYAILIPIIGSWSDGFFPNDIDFLWIMPIGLLLFAILGRYLTISSSKLIFLEEKISVLNAHKEANKANSADAKSRAAD